LNSAALAKLDLNRATAQELELLPGIGPQRAQQIIARRAEKGPFRSAGELADLPGFPRSLVERLAPMLTVGPPAP
jgi:competence protein ComEA